MMKFKLLLITALLALCCASKTSAQERPVTAAFTADIGREILHSNYLSPLRYDGLSLGISGEWMKTLPWQRNSWRMLFDSSIHSAFTQNPRRNANIYDLGLSFSWGAEKVWTPIVGFHNLQLTLGAAAGFNAGCLYAPRNGNNPADARLRAGFSLTASAAYPLTIKKLRILFSDRVQLPAVGAFFSQQYGEPYYEIYEGNHSGLAHFSYPGNNFCIDNRLTADLLLGKCALRVGYRLEVNSKWINSLNTRTVNHSFIIGILFTPPSLAPVSDRYNALYR